MIGKIKSGQGTLIGNSGEFYVVAELLKRGVIAALAPRNTPSFDVLAAKGNRTIKIRVKTKSENCPIWQWSSKKDGSIIREISKDGDYTILVDLADETKNLKFYIIPTYLVDSWLKKDFTKWLKSPGKNGRAHSSNNPKRHIDKEAYRDKLNIFLNKWDALWK